MGDVGGLMNAIKDAGDLLLLLLLFYFFGFWASDARY
jgi:hypothetical protein